MAREKNYMKNVPLYDVIAFNLTYALWQLSERHEEEVYLKMMNEILDGKGLKKETYSKLTDLANDLASSGEIYWDQRRRSAFIQGYEQGRKHQRLYGNQASVLYKKQCLEPWVENPKTKWPPKISEEIEIKRAGGRRKGEIVCSDEIKRA